MTGTKRKIGRAKLFIVDPREAELEQRSAALRQGGFEVVSLARPETAVTMFSVLQPDAVVLTPGADPAVAIAIARRLRQLSHGALPLIYLLPDGATPELRLRYLTRGQAAEVLSEPIDLEELGARARAQIALCDAARRVERDALAVRHPALHDPLTELHERPFFLELLSLELRRCERYGGVFSVASCSVAGFARFRQDFGAEIADRLLVYVATVLQQTVRDADVVARVGEDGFAIFFPGAPAEQLPALLERLTARFEDARFQVDGEWVKAWVAFGAVSFPDRVGSGEQLLTEAFRDARRGREGGRRTTALIRRDHGEGGGAARRGF